MEFTDSAEQADLRSAVRAFARRHATPRLVRAAMAAPARYDHKIWERLTTELGLTALAVPEGFGGVGAGPGEVAVTVAEFGRVLLPSPYLSSAVAALALGRASPECPDAAERYLPRSTASRSRSVTSRRGISLAGRSAHQPACCPPDDPVTARADRPPARR